MKPIRLPFRVSVTLSDQPTEIYPADFQKVRDRCMQVVYSASAIEDVLTTILEFGLFHGLPLGRRMLLRSVLLDSEWCSFSAKRRLLDVVRKDRSLVPDDWVALDQNLAKVMRSRNALAHGSISLANGEYSLSYFEGAPKASVLDDDYWTDVETSFNGAFTGLLALQAQCIPAEA